MMNFNDNFKNKIINTLLKNMPSTFKDEDGKLYMHYDTMCLRRTSHYDLRLEFLSKGEVIFYKDFNNTFDVGDYIMIFNLDGRTPLNID